MPASPKHHQQQQQASLSIPPFRRVVSFVGRDEGFDLFGMDGSGAMDIDFDNPLPSPTLLENIDYSFSSEFRSHTQGPLNFDFANINGDTVLGAIPAVQPSIIVDSAPAAAFPPAADGTTGEQDDNEISCGTYTRAERRKIIENYRNKKSRRQWGKRVMYACRQNFAQNRPRVHGRFVKLDPDALKAAKRAAAKAAKSPEMQPCEAVVGTPESPLHLDLYGDTMDESSDSEIEIIAGSSPSWEREGDDVTVRISRF